MNTKSCIKISFGYVLSYTKHKNTNDLKEKLYTIMSEWLLEQYYIMML